MKQSIAIVVAALILAAAILVLFRFDVNAEGTTKIDRWTGATYRIHTTSAGRLGWYEMD